jgi:hypothetical protein
VVALPPPPVQPVGEGAPHIDGLFPARGPFGTSVTISGSEFAADDNLITFGPSLGLVYPDGTPGNAVARVSSEDGRTLQFTVPEHSPAGILCDTSGSCVGMTAILPRPASYEVRVVNALGLSNVVRFELTSESASD